MPRSIAVPWPRRPRAALLRGVLLGLALIGAGPLGATELRMLTSWTPTYIGVPKMAERYADKVAAASGGGIRFTLTGPEGIPPFEQFTPVALGIFDVLYTHGTYHFAQTAIGLALDAISGEPAMLRSSGVWTAVDQHYNTHGLKLLALPVSTLGYQIYLREPVGEHCDLTGRRIRGSRLYHHLLAELGATAVGLPAAEIHAALEKNVIDGAAWTAVGGLDFNWHEVSRYLLRPTFGSVTHLLLMNLDTWRGLGADDQAVLLAVGAELEQRSYRRFKKYATTEENELKLRGMQTTELCGKPLAQLAQYWADGVWQLAIEQAGESARSLRELARTAHLTH